MSRPQIEAYQFGRIVVGGQSHTKDLIILPDRIIAGWWRKEGHNLHRDDLEAVFDAKPDLLVVGQGAYGRMQVTDEARQALRAAGIDLIAQSTNEACQTYNELCERRSVAAALHLTC
jgi:hypothetical protein